jgi:Uncharacterized conserved protein
MRVEIIGRCSSKYTVLLRIYCAMCAVVTSAGACALWLMHYSGAALALGGVCAAVCGAGIVIPLGFGRIGYLRSGGCLRVEKGLLVRRAVVISRSDVRASEIRGGPIQRRLGLCTVVFFTGGGKVTLRGVETGDGRLLNRLMTESADG